LQLATGDLLDPHTFHLQFIKDKKKIILSGAPSLVLHFSLHQTDPLAVFPSADMSFKWNYASSMDHAVPVLQPHFGNGCKLII